MASELKQWPEHIGGYSREEVEQYCVRDKDWQHFRKSLKGFPTGEKLYELKQWLESKTNRHPRRTRVQVDNYLNALKRGGQLDMDGRVVR